MLKKLGLFLIIVLLININPLAQEVPKKPSRAKMTISENVWDFGFVPQKSPVSHIYKITNEGRDTLIIERVRPSCGCTAAPLKKNK